MALFAAARVRDVTLLERLPAIAADMEVTSRNEMLEQIGRAGIVVRTRHQAQRSPTVAAAWSRSERPWHPSRPLPRQDSA
jgi:hypothetical protein